MGLPGGPWAGLTSHYTAWVQAAGLLAPVGTDPRAGREVPAGLWPDIKNLRDQWGRQP